MQLLAQRGHQGGETLPLRWLARGAVGGPCRRQFEFIRPVLPLRVTGGGNQRGTCQGRPCRVRSACTAR